jgi:hypothetical protein
VTDNGRVLLSRRAAAFLLAAGVFQWVVWPVFLKNIAADPRSTAGGSVTGFFVVHAVLTLASLAVGTALLRLGARGLRRTHD